MNERWEKIERLYHAARERTREQQGRFLDEACRCDAEMRRQVDVLLNQDREDSSFLARPAVEFAARLTPVSSLVPNTHIGPYEVLGVIGKGGMGEVYRARDSKLERDVAIKILPREFAVDPDRVNRLVREARVLASLNHPNIAAIYGVEEFGGAPSLILELVEGPTLSDVVARGPMPLHDALTVGRQIAKAIEAAHEKGILHRDLKPENIKLRPDGVVKVLDFGLAKAFAGDSPIDTVPSPGITGDRTEPSVILGTPAYMSPEQARGKLLDKRADIWSFACVLYEMLAGQRAFAGETVSDAIAAILGSEPEWRALPAQMPDSIRRLLQRCLEKDARRRLRDIGDVGLEIEHALAGEWRPHARWTALLRVPSPQARRHRWQVAIAALSLLTLLGTGGLFLLRYKTPASNVLDPAVQLTDFNDSALAPALSRDGRMLTFIRGGTFGNSSPAGQVYVKILPKGEPVQLTHDEFSKAQPVFSRDGSRIVYTAVTNGFRWDSWQVPVLGGSPQSFLPNASGLFWIDDEHMVYSAIMEGIHMGIVTSAENGAARRDVYMPRWQNSMAHRTALSPDRNSLLVVEMDGSGWLPCRLLPFDGSSTGRPVGPQEAQCTTAAWSPDGRWMYFSSNAGGAFHIWRQRYPGGMPEQITSGPTEQEGTAVTADGKYLITSMGLQGAAIWLHDAKGERPLTSEAFVMLPTMAPSGDHVFYLVRRDFARGYVSGGLWSVNLTTGERERAIPGRVMANYSISGDGKKVVFTTADNPPGDGIWIADLDRRSPPRQLTHGAEFRAFFGSPGEIIYMNQGETRHLFRMKEDGSGNEMISSDAVNYLVGVSPDGHWAVATLPPAKNKDGQSVVFFSTRGEKSVFVCSDGCTLGFGPARQQAPLFTWSMDGKSVFVALQYFGRRTARTVVLPYRSDVPLEKLWPKGLKSEADVAANPGARVISEADAFPSSAPSAYLFWKRVTQSNLYRIPIPN